MKLVAKGLVGGGAILVDDATETPLPVPSGYFTDATDAVAFLAWLGDPCGDSNHVRELARKWKRVKNLAPCPACPEGHHGRVEAGEALCEDCRAEVDADRPRWDSERERGRNEVLRVG